MFSFSFGHRTRQLCSEKHAVWGEAQKDIWNMQTSCITCFHLLQSFCLKQDNFPPTKHSDGAGVKTNKNTATGNQRLGHLKLECNLQVAKYAESGGFLTVHQGRTSQFK